MDLIRLLNLALVGLASNNALLDFLQFLLGLLLVQLVLGLDGVYRLLDLVDFVVLELLGVLVDALHAHDPLFLLAIEHQVLLVDVALGGDVVLVAGAAAGVLVLALGVVAGLAGSLGDVGGLAFCPYIGESLRVGHLLELSLGELGFFRVLRDDLPQ